MCSFEAQNEKHCHYNGLYCEREFLSRGHGRDKVRGKGNPDPLSLNKHTHTDCKEIESSVVVGEVKR